MPPAAENSTPARKRKLTRKTIFKTICENGVRETRK
jgi:hypothetical protein